MVCNSLNRALERAAEMKLLPRKNHDANDVTAPTHVASVVCNSEDNRMAVSMVNHASQPLLTPNIVALVE